MQLPFVPFVSSLLDDYDQRLVSGFMVSPDSDSMCKDTERAVEMMGQKGTFMLLILPPLCILRPHVMMDWMSCDVRKEWASKLLHTWSLVHIKNQGAEASAEEASKRDLPTAFICNTNNVVKINNDLTILANPNVPVADWFRCANNQLAQSSQEFRLMPLLKQQSKGDSVYSAVAVSLDEFEYSKELHSYGVKMEQPHESLWKVACNYTSQLLRVASDRDVFDFVMFKERTLSGVLLPGLEASRIADVSTLLDIAFV